MAMKCMMDNGNLEIDDVDQRRVDTDYAFSHNHWLHYAD